MTRIEVPNSSLRGNAPRRFMRALALLVVLVGCCRKAAV